MSERYEIREQPPSVQARSFGVDYPLFVVWDRVRCRRLPFGNYRDRSRAVERVKREEAKP